jgi:queuine tRNA-ribosyltransferase
VNTSPLSFELQKTDPTGARAGILHTRRGPIETPAFMPVGTHAAVRTLGWHEVHATGARMVLGNTFHLMLRPGVEVFERFGGIHRFMAWPGAVLTDSGGFQIFSLPTEREITEKGAHFRSRHDNARQMLSPERSVAVQQAIGSEIMMVLDVCIDSREAERGTLEAMERTHRWALRSLAAKQARETGQALFAIVQGGVFRALREASADFLVAHPFDGFAIGGLAVGETRDEREAMTEVVTARLPTDRPRYLMGVGTPADLVAAVRRGVDMFDCILPTKMGQQGYAYTFGGLLRVSRDAFRLDDRPLDEDCPCPTCRTQSRGYLHHLLRAEQWQGPRLLAQHNLHHYQVLMRRIRAAILESRYSDLCAELARSAERAKAG